jgi:hypothetical protein
MIEMISIFGVQIVTYHNLLVELHTGIAVLAYIALAVRVLGDLRFRGKQPSELVLAIRRDGDVVAYTLAYACVFFIVLSAITGALIEPYSVLTTTPILLNKSLVALGALYFWATFVFIRYWEGPRLWNKAGLYALAFVTATFAVIFTTFSGSIGGELSPLGQSVLDPLYKALGFSFRTLKLTQNDVYLTAGLLVVGVLIAGVLSMRWAKPTSSTRLQ